MIGGTSFEVVSMFFLSSLLLFLLKISLQSAKRALYRIPALDKFREILRKKTPVTEPLMN